MNKKIGIVLLIFAMFMVTSCGSNLITEKSVVIGDCFVSLLQLEDELYIKTFAGSGDEIKSYKLCELSNDMDVNAKLYTENSKDFYVFIENQSGSSADIYMYSSEKKQATFLGDIKSSNENILVVDNVVYAYSKDVSNQKNMIYGYDLGNLTNIIMSAEVSNAPEDVVYCRKNNCIYMSSLNDKNNSLIMTLSLNDGSVKEVISDKKSFIGDIVCDEKSGNCYVSLIGYCDIDEKEYQDNRILIYDSNLSAIDTIILDKDNITKLAINNGTIYAITGKETKVCFKIDSKSNKVKSYVDYCEGTLYDMTVGDNTVCFLSNSNINFEKNEKITSVESGNNISCISLY